MEDGWYHLVTPWGAGGILIQKNRAVYGAPIFRRLIGQDPRRWPHCWKLTKVERG